MPLDNEFTRLNLLMNSDSMGGYRHVAGRGHAWSHDTAAAPLGVGHQTIHGFYTAGGHQIATTITVKSTLGFDQGDQDRIVRWFFEDGTLHQSNKVNNPPVGYMGYLHDYGRNRLYAVTGIDDAQRIVTIPRIGSVNNGWHNF